MELRKFSTLINVVTFELCWFGCVLGAAKGFGWLGPLLVLITVPLQVQFLTENHKAEYLFVLLCGAGGFILETLMILGGVYIPIGSGRISPLWMTALWFNFGPLIILSLAWLKRKNWLAVILGGLGGPLAYWGGEKLGALTLATEFSKSYIPLALVWAMVLPGLVVMRIKILSSRS